ncbi:GNAT family N-acetyltransferase [Ferdinandcohnia quinoae]|uniref:GNAT family N-acetyltransferase n=1 Tax=Fredinandcohnia quinoae TaxID=2918902 RepID=A0AAW5E0V1_9BACI|nr:GNAT family N-acetyltransferase [Fredinandcohnia sp. SECRCQ15]MCH1625948.1 GNAT family N-acetyltransferase [Fredinandcohnia sp. SECRCQ15]
MKYIPLDARRLPELVTLWNSAIGTDFPMREDLFKQNSFDDENLYTEGSFIAIEDDQVIGFIISKRWQENIEIQMNSEIGWIQALIVDSSNRGKGVGSALLNKAEIALQNSGCKRILLGRDPWHYFPGIPFEYELVRNWFEHRGYLAANIESDLVKHYEDDEIDDIPDLENVQFTLLKEDEKGQLLEFLHRCFPGRWEYEAYHYFKKGGTGREFVVLKKGDKIIGFCRINDAASPYIAQNVYWSSLFQDELGGVGPLGIDSGERKQGYGLAIVKAGIAFLRKRMIHHIVIDWTGLTDFYGRLGFNVWKEYQQYYKEL